MRHIPLPMNRPTRSPIAANDSSLLIVSPTEAPYDDKFREMNDINPLMDYRNFYSEKQHGQRLGDDFFRRNSIPSTFFFSFPEKQKGADVIISGKGSLSLLLLRSPFQLGCNWLVQSYLTSRYGSAGIFFFIVI
ncbi:hypothetical protein CEXT_762871 [Caerostris extrusa]|uniref:Uncharacterized protein n=1 Tax=Caerostris extrusa TaxID=172846 RepID=A0AAV4S2T8_CAEEX|nr:hypothetical protein CEXT_762871 [Caerostris extrusa]